MSVRISSLLKTTAIYGIATVLPRILNLFLTPLHISNLQNWQYGIYQGLFAYMIMGNVILTYGMETAFFRFVNKHPSSGVVSQTALWAIFSTTFLFASTCLLFCPQIGQFLSYPPSYVRYCVLILSLDTLCAIPFAWFRNSGRADLYSFVKVGNVGVNLLLNIFFFYVTPHLFDNLLDAVFLSNLIASFLTFVSLLGVYKKIGLGFDFSVFVQMFKYGFFILLAGIAFSINESFDRIIIRYLYPSSTSDVAVGLYSACYKMGVFMNLFTTAYKMGVEPLFFSKASKGDARQTYAQIMEVFVVFSCLIFVFVMSYVDILKRILIPSSSYWQAMDIVPLILAGNMFLGIYHNLSVWYKVTDKTHWGAYISLASGCVTLALNFVLIPHLGYFGAAVTTFLAYFSMAFFSFLLGQKYYPIAYNTKKICLHLCLSIFLSLLNFYVFDSSIVCGSVIFFSFSVFVIYFNKHIFKELLFPHRD